MAENILKRAQLLASSGRLLVRAAKMQKDQKASPQALAPTLSKLDEVARALSKRNVRAAEASLKEARVELAAVRLIKLSKRIAKSKMH